VSPSCVGFMTHRFDGVVRSRFDRLLRECAGVRDVYLVAEQGMAVPDEYRPRFHDFDFSVLRRRARSIVGDSVAPGNCHLRMLSFFEAFPSYEWYWFVEYDVFYDGDWNAFFADFDEEPAHLLGAHVRTLACDPGWYWSATFDPGDDQVGLEKRRMAFLPVTRVSAEALRSIHRAVERGWTGHFEMVVPTAIEQAGLTISDIGGSSSYTPPHREQRHYLSAGNVWESPPLSTLRFRPVFFRVLPRLRSTLYHPDKAQRASLADILLALRLFKQTVVGHPRKSLRYWYTIAAQLVAQRAWAITRIARAR
jgi:hypothetical protein